MRTHSCTFADMRPPEVLSFREFRAGLAATLKRVQSPGSEPVFVGAHRRPEAVVMSVSHYEALVAAAERREAVAEALASVRAEGLEPSTEALQLFTAVASGDLDTDELRERVLARYHR
jgi:PHD/YefM family antitoxin component YafN of YafNO toxin-antitoxin module